MSPEASSNKAQTNLLWIAFVLLLVSIPTLFFIQQRQQKDQAQVELVDYGAAPSFELIDQDNTIFSSDQLQGKVWVSNFIFTSCGVSCPVLTSKMARLQSTLPGTVHLLSITVDPKNDTPKRLRSYGSGYSANFKRWHFLTGEDEAIQELVKKGFKLNMIEGKDPNEPIVHSQRFVLVDQAGTIRGYFNSEDAQDMKRLTLVTKQLLQ